MKQNNIIKSLLLASSLLGLTSVGRAEDTAPAAAPLSSMGLLGQTYAGVSYTYTHLDDSPVNAEGFGFQYNQNLNAGLDGLLNYDWAQSGVVAGSRAKQQDLTAGLRAYSTAYSWGKPYVEAGVGYAWTKFAGTHDHSFMWEAAVGAEFQVAPAATVTPFVQYSDAPDLASKGTWNYGVKANYWISNQWSVMIGVNRDDDQNMNYTVGTNFRF